MTQSWLWTILSCPRYYKCKLILTWNYILNAADLEIFLTFPQGALTCSWSTIPRRVLQTPSGWIWLFINIPFLWYMGIIVVSALTSVPCIPSKFPLDQTHAANTNTNAFSQCFFSSRPTLPTRGWSAQVLIRPPAITTEGDCFLFI